MQQFEQWQIDAFKSLPLTYHALAMEITNRCTAQCSICYQSAVKPNSPKAVDLPEEFAKQAITDASKSPFIYKRFHLAGGEAFLDLDKCMRLFEHAKKSGFFEITATTNAFWAKNLSKARKIAEKLRKNGVTGLEVSSDYWHQQYVLPSAIDNCVTACKEVDIKIILRVLSTKTHPIGETFKFLDSKTLEISNIIVCGNVFLTGKAGIELTSTEVKTNCFNFPCYSVLNFAVNTHGTVTPCCAGLDQSKLNFGNIKENSLTEIVASMNKSQIARILAFFGTSFFLPILEKAGIYLTKDKTFATACELCSTIFSDERHILVIEDHLRELQKKSIQQAISYLKDKQQSTVSHTEV